MLEAGPGPTASASLQVIITKAPSAPHSANSLAPGTAIGYVSGGASLTRPVHSNALNQGIVMTSKVGLAGVLQTRRQEILAKWQRQRLQGPVSAKGRLSNDDIGRQAGEFLSLLAAAPDQSANDLS